VEITALDTHRLRRAVLRDGRLDADVVWDGDDEPTTFHLGIDVDGAIVAISTWLARPSPTAAGMAAVQLRGMATDPAHARRGLGSLLLAHGLARVRQGGDTSVWANARVTAISFYERHGFEAFGPVFETADTGRPHRLVRTTV
jgi:GNAT superfamily N-acetyltransferase